MKQSKVVPAVHLFVCTNHRDSSSPLGTGCAERGEKIFALYKNRSVRDLARSVWITQTGCLGICPKVGATIAAYPSGDIVSEVTELDAEALYDAWTSGKPGATENQ